MQILVERSNAKVKYDAAFIWVFGQKSLYFVYSLMNNVMYCVCYSELQSCRHSNNGSE